MRRSHGIKALGIEKKYALAAALLGALIVGYALIPDAAPVKPVEVSFTDGSAGGTEIVPASCASAPPIAPNNGSAYQRREQCRGQHARLQFLRNQQRGPDVFRSRPQRRGSAGFL